MPTSTSAQLGGSFIADTLPTSCNIGNLGYKTSSTVGLYLCTALNTWTLVSVLNNSGGSSALPVGFIGMAISGTCPVGTSEVAALDGQMLVGTLAAHGDVGTTGGSTTITPTGSFSGNSVVSSAVSAGTPSGTNSTGTVTPLGTIAWPAATPVFTGTVNTLGVTAHTIVATKQGAAAGNVVTTATHTITGVPGGSNTWPAGVPIFSGSSSVTSAEVFTGSALGTHTHMTTATGSLNMNAFDPRPTFTRVIFCAVS